MRFAIYKADEAFLCDELYKTNLMNYPVVGSGCSHAELASALRTKTRTDGETSSARLQVVFKVKLFKIG